MLYLDVIIIIIMLLYQTGWLPFKIHLKISSKPRNMDCVLINL